MDETEMAENDKLNAVSLDDGRYKCRFLAVSCG